MAAKFEPDEIEVLILPIQPALPPGRLRANRQKLLAESSYFQAEYLRHYVRDCTSKSGDAGVDAGAASPTGIQRHYATSDVPCLLLPPAISPLAFSILLQFVQTERLEVNEATASGVLHAAELLGMSKAADAVKLYIAGIRNSNTAMSTMSTIAIEAASKINPFGGTGNSLFLHLVLQNWGRIFAAQLNTSVVADVHNRLHHSSAKLPAEGNAGDRHNGTQAVCDGPIYFQRVANPLYVRAPVSGMTSNLGVCAQDVPKPTNVYQCPYCKDSFKSLYCFEKHKKRHLTSADSLLSQKAVNVRFYPCRACGLKFPSYYFVHKHRKYCDLAKLYEASVPIHGNRLSKKQLLH